MDISEYYWQLGIKLTLTIFGVIRIAWFIRKNQSVEFLIPAFLLTIALGINLVQQNLFLGLTHLYMERIFLFGLIIIFEPEIYWLLRSFFSQMGNKKNGNLGVIQEIVAGAQILASTKTGALIAFEREDDLGKLCQSGTPVNSDVKKELLTALFSKDALTHDGGAIIKNGRITHCSVIFPLTFSLEIDKKFGTRHRAAIGLTESTDAICLVVSEEEGTISLAKDGEVFYNLDPKNIERSLSLWLSKRTQKRFYPVHRFRTFHITEQSSILLRFLNSTPARFYDFIFFLFWAFFSANFLLVSYGSIDQLVLNDFFSLETLTNEPWQWIPPVLMIVHAWCTFLKKEIRFDQGTHQFTKESKLLILPVTFIKRPLENCARVHVKRESRKAPLWSIYLEDKKGKKIKLDSSGWQNSLIASAKQIHEFLKIELINHS